MNMKSTLCMKCRCKYLEIKFEMLISCLIFICFQPKCCHSAKLNYLHLSNTFGGDSISSLFMVYKWEQTTDTTRLRLTGSRSLYEKCVRVCVCARVHDYKVKEIKNAFSTPSRQCGWTSLWFPGVIIWAESQSLGNSCCCCGMQVGIWFLCVYLFIFSILTQSL